MQFWIRQSLLIIVCIVVPFAAALHLDAASEVERARAGGVTAVRLASKGLEARLMLDAHAAVGAAVSLSQRLSDQDMVGEVIRGSAKGKALFPALVSALDAVTPASGFVWVADAQGRIVATNGMAEPGASPRVIAGHPIFLQVMQGLALDGVWSDREKRLDLVAAAPLIERGEAAGAVFVGRTVTNAMLAELAASLEAEVTLASGGTVLATTLDAAAAKEVAEDTPAMEGTAHIGRLPEPLPGGSILPSPLLVDPRAEGIAQTVLPTRVIGAPGNARWVVSVRSVGGLPEIASRQEMVIGVMIAAAMMALLLGMVSYRTFVSPIERVASHLSELQLGRGDLELPESAVPPPFRRLVRLVNMTVQKMPSRSLSTMAASGSAPEVAASVRRESFSLPPSGAAPAVTPPPVVAKPATPPAAPTPEPTLPPPPLVQEEDEGLVNLEQSLLGEEEDPAAAIAEALASLEGRPPSGLEAPAMSESRRSASTIRGGTPRGGAEAPSPFTPSQSEFLREGATLSYAAQDDAVGARPAPGVRGGGSLNLGGFAGLSAPAARTIDSAPFDEGGFNPEATVVAPVAEDLLARSARDDLTDSIRAITDARPDMTVVASVPADLLAQSAGEGPLPRGASAVGGDNGLDASDRAHFKEVYERFIDMRRRCGEDTEDLAFDRFLTKLTRNREALIKKYQCRTVRFQVYEKDGKAALKATPVRAR